jgi:hypothetical protein
MLENVLFVGISDSYESENYELPFHLKQSVVLEKENKQSVYVFPNSIRYYEDTLPLETH